MIYCSITQLLYVCNSITCVYKWYIQCRPLPRGLIKFEEVSLFLNIAMLSTVVYGVLLGLRFGTSVAVSYELQVHTYIHT